MHWKSRLLELEHNKQWDEAILFMENVIRDNRHDVDVYLGILYLLMNLLVEEDYINDKHDYYESLSKKYFVESYAQFSNNAKYLFFVSRIAYMSEWYFDISYDFANEMGKQFVSVGILY